MTVREIVKYQCSDGEEFASKESADEHEERILCVKVANEELWAGASLSTALIIAGVKDPPEILMRVNKDTKLIIPHWQCMDTPGYRPCRITTKLQVFVHGDAGSNWGAYGNYVSIPDLVRYVENTFEKLSSTTERSDVQ